MIFFLLLLLFQFKQKTIITQEVDKKCYERIKGKMLETVLKVKDVKQDLESFKRML